MELQFRLEGSVLSTHLHWPHPTCDELVSPGHDAPRAMKLVEPHRETMKLYNPLADLLTWAVVSRWLPGATALATREVSSTHIKPKVRALEVTPMLAPFPEFATDPHAALATVIVVVVLDSHTHES